MVNFSVLEKKDDDKDDGEPTTPPSEEPEKPTNWFVTKVTEPVKQSVEKVLENTVGKLDQKTAQVFTVSTSCYKCGCWYGFNYQYAWNYSLSSSENILGVLEFNRI